MTPPFRPDAPLTALDRVRTPRAARVVGRLLLTLFLLALSLIHI